jgi:phospho-N-acetylmuramoyl-pentapeptide-transferase
MLSLMESGGVGFLLALLLTPLWMRFVQARSYGQVVSEDGPVAHQRKTGTPTMGGVVIVFAAVMGYAMGHIGRLYAIRDPGRLGDRRFGPTRIH